MKTHYLLIIGVLFLSCSEGKKSTKYGIALNSSDRVYGAFCIDETLNDTLVSFSVNLINNKAEISLSDKIDLGFSIFYEQQDKKKIYNVSLAKLRNNTSGKFTADLKTGTLFSPAKKQNIVQNFSNSILVTRMNPDNTIFTTNQSGCGETLEQGIFEMSWFPEFSDHRYTVIEYYQDSERSWTNIYRR